MQHQQHCHPRLRATRSLDPGLSGGLGGGAPGGGPLCRSDALSSLHLASLGPQTDPRAQPAGVSFDGWVIVEGQPTSRSAESPHTSRGPRGSAEDSGSKREEAGAGARKKRWSSLHGPRRDGGGVPGPEGEAEARRKRWSSLHGPRRDGGGVPGPEEETGTRRKRWSSLHGPRRNGEGMQGLEEETGSQRMIWSSLHGPGKDGGELWGPGGSSERESSCWLVSPGGDLTWVTGGGEGVRLGPVALGALSELERARLQEAALARLADMQLPCNIAIPKDGQKRKKSLRRKLDTTLSREKSKDKESPPRAFGLPLLQVIANDLELKQRRELLSSCVPDPSPPPPPLAHPGSVGSGGTGSRGVGSELTGSALESSAAGSTRDEGGENAGRATAGRTRPQQRRGAMSVDSLAELQGNPSRLLEALQLSLPADAAAGGGGGSTRGRWRRGEGQRLSLNPTFPRVPRVVEACCSHLEQHALHTVGIFRVGSSKKRVRQLRDQFDRGGEEAASIGEEASAHDVAALLKEFLRDLAEPLLSRELYPAFVHAAGLDPGQQVPLLRLLVCLLPPCNCDTLHRVLSFLATVARHAGTQADTGEQVSGGNKMTAQNLATVFGPNLLRGERSVREDSTAVIATTCSLIEQHEQVFLIPPELQHEVLLRLMESDPEVVEHLLRRKAAGAGVAERGWPSVPGRDGSSESLEGGSSADGDGDGEGSPYENTSPVLGARGAVAAEGASTVQRRTHAWMPWQHPHTHRTHRPHDPLNRLPHPDMVATPSRAPDLDLDLMTLRDNDSRSHVAPGGAEVGGGGGGGPIPLTRTRSSGPGVTDTQDLVGTNTREGLGRPGQGPGGVEDGRRFHCINSSSCKVSSSSGNSGSSGGRNNSFLFSQSQPDLPSLGGPNPAELNGRGWDGIPYSPAVQARLGPVKCLPRDAPASRTFFTSQAGAAKGSNVGDAGGMGPGGAVSRWVRALPAEGRPSEGSPDARRIGNLSPEQSDSIPETFV
ncbi:unnamed protein product [Lampetra fluviatilis]